MFASSLWSAWLIEELSPWATLWPIIHKPRMCGEITISIPERKWTLFSAQMQGLPFFFDQTDTVASQIKARVTAEATMGGIDGLNKDTSVWWCATQLPPQVGRDNGTRAACPCKTCDVAEDIRGCKTDNNTNTPKSSTTRPAAKMRFLVPLFVFLAVAAFHSGKKNK